MTHIRRAFGLRMSTVLTGALLLPLISASLSAAVPSSPPELAASRTKTAEVMQVSLETTTPSVPVSGSLDFTGLIRLSQSASYLQARIRLSRPSGRLLYQKTQVLTAPGLAPNARFTRALGDLGLKPGVYPVDLEVRATVGGRTQSATAHSELMVYDPATPPVPLVLAARVSGQPLSDPQGRFVLDPAGYTRAREEADAAAEAVLADANVRLTLSVSPVLLAEWRTISGGYEFAGPEGSTTYQSSDAVPQAYAQTLSRLKAAIATGRLELVSTGYADPDLSDLSRQGLGRDAGVQYATGITSAFASLETTPSTGTVPADGCVPPGAVGALAEQGIGYAIVDARCARSGTATAASGAYPLSATSMRALVTDDPSSAATSSADTTVAVHRAFARAVSAGATKPFVVALDLSRARDGVGMLGAYIEAFVDAPWARLTVGRDATQPASGTSAVVLTESTHTPAAPEGYWTEAGRARSYAEGMLAALGAGDADASAAQIDSLIAESSSWAGLDDRWLLADRGRSFSAAALRTGGALFSRVTVKVASVTLAGTRGEVPLSIVNASDKTLKVTVRATPSGGVKLTGARSVPVTLRPQENFVQLPVDMQSSFSGNMHVEVVAGDLVIAEDTIPVKASYLDRLVLIGGVVLLLGMMLAFIIRRVRAANARAELEDGAPDARVGHARYTGSDQDS